VRLICNDMVNLKINVNIEYPEDMDYLIEKEAKIVSQILIKKLKPSEVEQLIEILEDDTKNITW